MERPLETALVFVLDDAEPFDAVRRELAPETVARGIPFHITLLYPFAPRDEVDDVIDDVRDFFAGVQPFSFRLTRVAHWPAVIYAVPQPDEPLRQCIRDLDGRFPEWPPYGGAHREMIPHATLAERPDAALLYADVERRLAPHLPRNYTADAATLLEESVPGRWRERERIALGDP